jgi:plasmid stabilization system protein ParE
MKVRFTFNARRRMRHIEDYHAEHGSAKKGRKTVQEILRRADELERHPLLGPEEENLEHMQQGHRSLLVGTLYKIVYLIVKPVILITDIFDVRQDSDKMKP